MAKLVLVRHGQSIWNLENRFTGWADIPLSSKGIKEAQKAGRKLKNFKFDVAYTSELIRSQLTLFEILEINENENKFFRIHDSQKGNYNKFLKKNPNKEHYLKVFYSEKLNERNYGDLEGRNKDKMREEVGEEQVHIWRRSYDIAPPNGESLKDTAKRCLPYFKKHILKQIKDGKDVICSAHGNTLRAIVMHLENISKEKITEYEIKTGVPYVYHFNKDMNVTKKEVLD